MPTINNYTFSPVSFQVEEQSDIIDSIGQNFATITIYPNDGFAVSASDFSANGYDESYIDSVEFVQSGNNVVCNVFFVAGITMPSANVNLPLCIIGQGVVNEITIAGTFTANIGPNITGDGTELNTPYSNSGAFAETELLFSKTYSAAANYYLDIGSGMQVVEGNANNYTINQVPSYTNDYLTSITYNVNYTYPSQSISGDRIAIRLISAKEIFIPPTPKITKWCFFPKSVCLKGYSNPAAMGETKRFRIFGDEGAVFSLTLTDDNVDTGPNTFTPTVNGLPATNITMPSEGYVDALITFPSIVGQPTYSIPGNWVTYTALLTGDISSEINPAPQLYFTQFTSLPKITISGKSIYGITGFNDVEVEGAALTTLKEGEVLIDIDWDLTAPAGATISPSNLTVDALISENIEPADAFTTAQVINSSTIQVDDSSSFLVGDKFNIQKIEANEVSDYNTANDLIKSRDIINGTGVAPFEFTITNINSATEIEVSPNISLPNNYNIIAWRTGGNVINTAPLPNTNVSNLTQINNTSINFKYRFSVMSFGTENTNIILDLDKIITTSVPTTCSSALVSGGLGVTDFSVDLDPAGGLITFLVRPQSVPDKFEIIHGLPNGDKKATSSTKASDNYGPFDNIFGTEILNTIPTLAETSGIDQFIGSSKGALPTRETEFNLDTDFDIPSMTVGGKTYQQIVWWKYTSDDYNKSSIATFRVTSPSGSSWDAYRVCCPDANCQSFVPSPFGLTAANSTASNACADTSYVNTIYVSYDQFELGKTVYTDSGLTTGNEFVGDGTSFYGVDDTPGIAIKIDANGVIIDYIHLCVTLP